MFRIAICPAPLMEHYYNNTYSSRSNKRSPGCSR